MNSLQQLSNALSEYEAEAREELRETEGGFQVEKELKEKAENLRIAAVIVNQMAVLDDGLESLKELFGLVSK